MTPGGVLRCRRRDCTAQLDVPADRLLEPVALGVVLLTECAGELDGAESLEDLPGVGQVGEAVDDLAPEALEHQPRRLERARYGGIERKAACVGAPGNPEVGEVAFEREGEGQRPARARRADCADRARRSPGAAGRRRPRSCPSGPPRRAVTTGLGRPARNPTGRRAQPDHVAERRGVSQRAAHVAPVRDRDQPAGQGGGRASARAAAGPLERVGIPGRAEDLVEGLRARAELRGVRLPHRDRSRCLQALDEQRRLGRNPAAVDRRPVGRPDACGVDEILVGDRQAVQDTGRRAPVESHGAAAERLLGDECHDRVHLRVDPLDLGEVRLHHLDGRELPRPQPAGQLRRVQKAEPVGHRPGSRSAGSRENITQSERRPFTSSRCRRTPSRWKPAFSATRWDATFSTSVTISTRTEPSSSKAHRASSLAPRAATPRPRAEAATQ